MISTKLITCRRGPLVRSARSSAATSGRGGVRKTGHEGGVGEHRGVARARPHPGEQTGSRRDAGARRSEARGGGRSSASSGNGLRGTGRPPEGLGGTLVALGARRDARFGRRRAETATATWTAARGFGRGGERHYGAETKGRREGNGGGAHRGSNGIVGELGEGLGQPERRRRSRRPELEDDGDCDEAGLPRVACSVRRERGSRRSWEACRGGAAVAEATVAMDGGDGDFGRERGGEGEERMTRERGG